MKLRKRTAAAVSRLGHPFFPPRWPWLGPCPGFDYARPLASPSARKGYSWTWRVSYWPSINAVVHAGSNPKRLFTDHSLLKKFFVESTEMTIPLNSGLLRFPAPYFCILVLIQNFVWIPFFFIDATNTEKANKIELRNLQRTRMIFKCHIFLLIFMTWNMSVQLTLTFSFEDFVLWRTFPYMYRVLF